MQRPRKFAAAAALLISGLCGLTQPVHGQDFPLTIAGILCDTQEQVRSIVTANLRGSDAMRDTFLQLNGQVNGQNRPICSIQQMPHNLLSVPNSIDIGPWPENGDVLEAFTLHIQTGGLDAWFMYLAPGSLAPKNNGI